MHQKWKYHREEKQDFKRLLIFLNIKMSARSNKIELSEEFMVMSNKEQPLEMFCKKYFLRNFAEFTGKHLCQSLFFNKVSSLRSGTLIKKRVWHWCFPVKFAKILRTLLWQNTSGRLLLHMDSKGIFWQFPNQYISATLQNTCR